MVLRHKSPCLALGTSTVCSHHTTIRCLQLTALVAVMYAQQWVPKECIGIMSNMDVKWDNVAIEIFNASQRNLQLSICESGNHQKNGWKTNISLIIPSRNTDNILEKIIAYFTTGPAHQVMPFKINSHTPPLCSIFEIRL